MGTPRQLREHFFHVSPKENRVGIESEGLVPHNRHEGVQDVPAGVYVNQGKPDIDYGDDIYAIKKEAIDPIPDPMDELGFYSKHPVGISDFNRVGHVFINKGHTEIHWHKEEDCPNG